MYVLQFLIKLSLKKLKEKSKKNLVTKFLVVFSITFFFQLKENTSDFWNVVFD